MEWNGMELNWIGKAFRYSMNSNRQETGTRRSWSHTSNITPERLAERVWWTKSWIFISVPVDCSLIAPTYSLPPRCDYPFTLHQYVTEPIWYMTLHFQDRHGVASLRHRNSTEITVLMCEQESHPVLFSCLVWQNIRCDLEHRWSWRNKNNLRRTG